MISLVGHEEHRIYSGSEPPVHVRELELVLEVGQGAQTAHDDGRVAAAAKLDQQALELRELEPIGIAGQRIADELGPLLGREQRLLANVHADRDDHLLE